MNILEAQENPKLRKTDRILVLKPKEGKKVLNSTGLPDPKLFTGENELHAIMDKNCLWNLKYKYGGTPPPLKQKFTSFPKLMEFITRYFEKRNIEIAEVLD